MDNDTKKLLDETVTLAKENNMLLQKLVRAQKWAMIYRAVYWSIIIFSSLGAYYFIQPYIGNLLNLYTGGGATNMSTVNDITHKLSDKNQIQDLLNSIK